MSSTKKALALSGFWAAAAFVFFGVLRAMRGTEPANQFLAGYIMELSLSVDNVFVFALIFDYFKIELPQQRRVLFWGVLGSALLRGLFIIIGVNALQRFHWVLFCFGGLLVLTALKLIRSQFSPHAARPETNPAVRFVRRFIPMTEEGPVGGFFVRRQGRWIATRLLLVLVVIEVTDLIFAFDSLPAVLAFTRSMKIAFASNLFAVVGLRSLFVALGGARKRFRYLEVGLALVLLFVGAKILAEPWFVVPTDISLGIVCAVLTGAAVASRRRPGVQDVAL